MGHNFDRTRNDVSDSMTKENFWTIDCNSENFSENFAVLQTSQLISVPRPGEALASRQQLEKHASKVVIMVCIIQPPPSKCHFALDRKKNL